MFEAKYNPSLNNKVTIVYPMDDAGGRIAIPALRRKTIMDNMIIFSSTASMAPCKDGMPAGYG